MKRIGLLSDTHSYINPKISGFFAECDEIWHAGDIGDLETAKILASIKPLKAVIGNIDGNDLKSFYPPFQEFMCEDIKVLMLHTGGYPGKYSAEARQLIKEIAPALFITGHSHILKVINDPKNKLLHINPGAAGKQGFHEISTVVRFTIDGADIRDLEIMEMPKKQ
ncbi:MAG: metallophosphoesterase family protein [Lentimicrobiaceae bacterium]|nr:metallophosphoesterase family protein [Lentimicrobiaceae bacterium]MCB9024540.1 metallophosphoesterase family protein [Lentimicrobiaceae bacterium]MCO5266346.1 metallophosphatase family protein [Lentimicrobium sp.]HPG33334.1 metallophosphoesterase family protein [Lentimicrobium sp.]